MDKSYYIIESNNQTKEVNKEEYTNYIYDRIYNTMIDAFDDFTTDNNKNKYSLYIDTIEKYSESTTKDIVYESSLVPFNLDYKLELIRNQLANNFVQLDNILPSVDEKIFI